MRSRKLFSKSLLASLSTLLIAGLTTGCGGSRGPSVPADSSSSLYTYDGTGDGTGDGTTGTGSYVAISGTANFEFVPVTAASGLSYSLISNHPIRGAVVEAIVVSTNQVYSRSVTDANGAYRVVAPYSTPVFVRVRAQLYRTGTPSWDVRLVDNTRAQAAYALDSSQFTTSTSDVSGLNLLARTGWSGSAYTLPRNAAPFAIMDTIYQGMQKVLAANPSVVLPQLLVNWSTKNTPASGDKTLGQIVTTHYNLDERQMYVLGAQGVDTDEFDNHVIAHEWMHYIEQRLSRSDSIGGSHTIQGKLDPRVAFSEGLANAFSGIATDSPLYYDSSGTTQATTQVAFDLTNQALAGTNKGWFNEASIQSLIYALYSDRGASSYSDFLPIYDVLTNGHRTNRAFTTLYSFAVAFKASYPDSVTRLNTLLAAQSVSTTATNEFDSTKTESNFGGVTGFNDIFRGVVVNSSTAVRMCATGATGAYNKLFNRRFFYFNADVAGTYHLTVTPVSTSGDPVVSLYQTGVLAGNADAGGAGVAETLNLSLSAGVYTGEVVDSKFYYGTSTASQCYDVKVTR